MADACGLLLLINSLSRTRRRLFNAPRRLAQCGTARAAVGLRSLASSKTLTASELREESTSEANITSATFQFNDSGISNALNPRPAELFSDRNRIGARHKQPKQDTCELWRQPVADGKWIDILEKQWTPACFLRGTVGILLPSVGGVPVMNSVQALT